MNIEREAFHYLLINDRDINLFPRAHCTHLKNYYPLSKKERTFEVDTVTDIARKFSLKGCDLDVLLYAILITGTSLDMRFDEKFKLKMELISINFADVDFVIRQRTNNSTVQ